MITDRELDVKQSEVAPTVFKTILDPLLPLLEAQCATLKGDATLYTLSLAPFVINLVFAVLNNIKSISLLVTEIDTSVVARELALTKASKSMYSEAFVRYRAATFRSLFHCLLEQLNFLGIPELQLLGRLVCVDGSIIPAIKTMSWATYKKSANALKVHVAFELNRMIPVQIISTDANTSERKILAQFLEAGVTYIADRGYLSFQMLQQILAKKAFFILRMKSIEVATSQSRTPPACGIATLLGKRLHRFWKISLHWLTRVKNLLLAPFDPETRTILTE